MRNPIKIMTDDLVERFHSSFLVGREVNDTQTPHPHYSLYKHKRDGGYGSQEARRKRFLEEQKTRRRDYADYARKIVDGEACEDENDSEIGEGDESNVESCEGSDPASSSKAAGVVESMEVSTRKKKRKTKYPYSGQLMLSEWLVDVPQDFHDNWLMVVCPVGKRSLVISGRKTTSAYSRAGCLINNFPSLLPGGCRKTHRLVRDYCILDCVFHEGSRTYYILDAMCWGGHPVYDSDTEFRVFWKATKVQEHDEITKYSRINPLPFLNLEYHPCTPESITKVLSDKWHFEVDGLLFVHKRSQYIIGRSPLSAWLKPHMVPDILKLPVSKEFLACSPILNAQSKMDTGSADTSNTKSARDKLLGQTKVPDDENAMVAESEDGSNMLTLSETQR